jgi:hypothetical protein
MEFRYGFLLEGGHLEVDVMGVGCDLDCTGLGSCLMAGFDVNGDERSGLFYVTSPMTFSNQDVLCVYSGL